jgi:hypothetical protein
MKLPTSQIEQLVRRIFKDLKAQNQIVFKAPEDKVFLRAVEIVKADFAREDALDREVNKMLDDLERQHSGEFQRYKMFPLLKRKLAKEKGIVL